MLQDRNIHRDAQALRKAVTVPLIVPVFGINQDEPIYASIPRYNWRLSDLSTHVSALATAPLIISAQAVPLFAVVGSPRLLPGSGVPTHLIDEYWRHAGGSVPSFSNVGATAAHSFANGDFGIATVLDGFWGVWTLLQDTSNNVDSVRQAPIMAFETEEIALANAPKVRDLGDDNGRLAILTVQAVGGDFIAGTTNTDAAIVAAFNTAPQQGHVVTIPTSVRPHYNESVLGQQLKDASGTNILQGKGGPGGDALVVMTKSGGAPVLTEPAQAVVEYRPWPAGGEGVGDASVSQNRPSFVP